MQAKLISKNPFRWQYSGKGIVNTNAFNVLPNGAVTVNGGLFILNLKTGKLTLNK